VLGLDTNAEEVSRSLLGVVVEAVAEADEEAARAALDMVAPKTPRRSGRLAAGLRAVVESAGGFAIVDAVPYATVVDARTGFASQTLLDGEASILAIYDRHLQDEFDAVR